MTLFGLVVCALTLVPSQFYPSLTEADLRAVSSADVRIQLQQAQAQLQNNVRSALLQTVAGTLVIVGAAATWRQVWVSREGQITERFTRAIEQIGNDNVDVRIGGVYALERIARNSPEDRRAVQFILTAFVRNHAPWHVGAPGGPEHPTSAIEERPWLQILAPDTHAAVSVLARRLPSPAAGRKVPGEATLYLPRVDLRGLQLHQGELVDVQLRYTNLARSWLRGIRLDHSDLKSADLRRCQLEEASFVRADLSHAYLGGANLRGADLRGADLSGADLEGARLEGARADATTVWPGSFDAERLHHAGVRLTG
ncbi:pentapeptide repeat-containing protein [Saccharopolyspora shandongensis]|uniref:pentapeptide repeat-containing protein n=1 Tax=Saccharopolyspora shandongensis TaxID=418495 RepID=UPI003411C87A